MAWKWVTILGCALAMLSAGASASDVPAEVVQLLAPMKKLGASVRGGTTKELGFFLVAIGRASYQDNAISKSRENAQNNALRELSGTLNTALKAKEVVRLKIEPDGDMTVAQAFVSSMTEASVNQVLSSVRVISSGKNAEDEMEVSLYVTSKRVEQPLERPPSGEVFAVGYGENREETERNALRSAVEQVAGTLVVGKVSVNDREEMHKLLAPMVTDLVDNREVIGVCQTECGYRAEVKAYVNKRKLYDKFQSFFRSLHNPDFFIEASSSDLERVFKPFFVEKGIPIVSDRENCHYVIKLNGEFSDMPTPYVASSMGTRLDLGIEVVSVGGQRVLLAMEEKCTKHSGVLDSNQRRKEVSRQIFKKVETRLDKALQDMRCRILGSQHTPVSAVSDSTGTDHL